MDDDTRGYLETMEATLMGGQNNAQEAIIERLRVLEAAIAALTEVARSTNTTMSRIVSLLTNDGPNPAEEA
jgi:hypothetical protein